MGQELAKELHRWRTAFYKVFFWGKTRVVSDLVVSLALSLCLKHRAGLCFAGQLSSKTQNLPAASPIPVHWISIFLVKKEEEITGSFVNQCICVNTVICRSYLLQDCCVNHMQPTGGNSLTLFLKWWISQWLGHSPAQAYLHRKLQSLPNVLSGTGFLRTCMAGCNSSHCSENRRMILDSHLKKTLSNQMHPYLARREI